MLPIIVRRYKEYTILTGLYIGSLVPSGTDLTRITGGILMITYAVLSFDVYVIEAFWFQFMEYRELGITVLLFSLGACWILILKYCSAPAFNGLTPK